jgi:hypothetical protein
MSIVRQLTQICMVRAFRGQTLAGNAVLDSNITGLSAFDYKDEQPVIACSIEEVELDDKYGRGLFGRAAETKIYIQTAVATKGSYIVVTGEGTERVEEFKEIGSTDAAREATLNILDRQWKQALTDPANVWGDRFRQLVPHVGRVKDLRITDPEGGRKYAARVYEISGTMIAEPDFGADLPEDIDAIMTAVGAIPDYADLIAIWRDLFSKAASDDPIARSQASAALSSTAFAALGLHRLDPEGDDFTTGVFANDGRDDIEVVAEDEDQP